MNLEKLIHEISKNPSTIKNYNKELQQIIENTNLNEFEILKNQNYEFYFYLLIEEKLKYYAINTINPLELINLLLSYTPQTPLGRNKMLNSLSLTSIYFFPSFFDIFTFTNHPEFLSLFEKFTYQIINNYEISENRRQEIRKALNLSSVFYANLFQEINAKNINLLINLVQIVDLENINLSNLLEKVDEKFFNDQNFMQLFSILLAEIHENEPKFDISKFLVIHSFLEPNPSFSKLLLKKNINAALYFYKAIETDNLSYALKFFKRNENEINQEIVNKFLTFSDQIEVYRFFCDLSKGNLSFNILNTIDLPDKICIQFLKNLNMEILCKITKQSLFISSYIQIKKKDKNVLKNIEYFESEEEKKLLMRIVEDFELTEEELKMLLNLFENRNNAILENKRTHKSEKNKIISGEYEELIIKCMIRLNLKWNFSISKETMKFFYFYMRDSKDFSFSNDFFSFLKETENFYFCFEVLIVLRKNLPDEIFPFILEKIPLLSLDELMPLLEFTRLIERADYKENFLFKITEKLIILSNDSQEFEKLEICLNRLLKINTNTNLFLELLQIEEYNIFKKILIILRKIDLKKVDLTKLTFFLLKKYSTSFFFDLQPQIIGILLKIIKIDFQPFLIFDVNSKDLVPMLQNLNEKKQRNLMKNFLNRIKANRMNELGALGKIKEQNFFTTKKEDSQDYDFSAFL